MLEGMTTAEILKMALPFIIMELALKIFCWAMIFKKGVRNLNKIIWALIVLLIPTTGSIAFLIFGRRNSYDN